jgi:hypothetical protein
MYNIEQNKIHKYKLFFICLIKIIISFIAIMLVLECNQYSSILYKIFIAITAGLFSEIYIIYYLIYRVFMGNKCSIN